MKGVYFNDDQILELITFLNDNRGVIVDYIKYKNLSFSEGCALLGACREIEKEWKGEEKIDI